MYRKLHYQGAILGVEKSLLVLLKSVRECRLVREILSHISPQGKVGVAPLTMSILRARIVGDSEASLNAVTRAGETEISKHIKGV